MAGSISACLVEVFHQLLLIARKISTSLPSSGTFPRDHKGGLQNHPGWGIHLLSDLGKSQRECLLLQPTTVSTSLAAAVPKRSGLCPKVVSEVLSMVPAGLSRANKSASCAASVQVQGFLSTCCLAEPILVCNLLPLIGLLVTYDQLPSPTKEGYLCFPPLLMNLWLCQRISRKWL